jgi:twitching motility protein PilJ
MMAEKSGVAGNMIRNPMVVTMLVLLLVMVAGLGGNFYMADQATQQQNQYMETASQIKTLSQEVAKHSVSASSGEMSAFSGLSSSSSQLDGAIASLPSSSELGQVSALWADMKSNVDIIAGQQKEVIVLRDISADLAITLSAIQTENNKVVAALLRSSVAANEVALAQRQSMLVERMSRSLDKALDGSSAKSLADNFNRDSLRYKQVLDGLKNGDKELLLNAATDAGVRTSLTKIEELYRTVSTRAGEIMTRSGNVARARSASDLVYAGSSDFLAASDRLNESYSKGRIGLGSPLFSLIFALGAIVILMIISFLIYREGNRGKGETNKQNEENQAAILQLLDELADLADGDLRVQATVTESFTGAIADSINFSIDQMRGMVSRINETSVKVSAVAGQTQSSVVQLADASERQSNEIGVVSDSVNEMAVSIDMVSYNAAESSSVAERSVDIAKTGASVVQNTIDGMDNIRGQIQETAKRIKRLGESSQEIGDIVALINDIADQTNILSLNAAIQASMAGDAGKGFAVVADEVQRLAERSGAAAKQISALIKTIQSDTNEAVSSMEQTTAEVVQGTRLAQDAGVALGEIEGVSKSLAEIIENISDAARQQAASAGKISNTMKSIQEISSTTTDGVRTTAEAIGGLAETTNDLRASVNSFKLPE